MKKYWFFSSNSEYQKNVATIDTYKILYSEITNFIKSSNKLLDIGHGGSFDYDTSKVKEITGLDLDKMIDVSKLPKNIKLVEGSAQTYPKVSKFWYNYCSNVTSPSSWKKCIGKSWKFR